MFAIIITGLLFVSTQTINAKTIEPKEFDNVLSATVPQSSGCSTVCLGLSVV